MSECRCGQPTRNDAYACDGCGDKTARALGDVPWLAEELETTITKQRAANEGGTPSAETPLMYHLPAAEKRDALRAALVTAVRFCNEEGVRNSDPGPEWPENDLVSMSRWLLWRVDGLALNDMGEEFAEGIRSAVNACRRAIDRPPERRYAGPCQECKRDLYHRPGSAEVGCPVCGSRWDVGELYAWMTAQVRDRLVTAREGVTLLCRFDLETAQSTIRKWQERGLVVDRGHDQEGRALFAFGDLLDVATRHTKAS